MRFVSYKEIIMENHSENVLKKVWKGQWDLWKWFNYSWCHLVVQCLQRTLNQLKTVYLLKSKEIWLINDISNLCQNHSILHAIQHMSDIFLMWQRQTIPCHISQCIAYRFILWTNGIQLNKNNRKRVIDIKMNHFQMIKIKYGRINVLSHVAKNQQCNIRDDCRSIASRKVHLKKNKIWDRSSFIYRTVLNKLLNNNCININGEFVTDLKMKLLNSNNWVVDSKSPYDPLMEYAINCAECQQRRS